MKRYDYKNGDKTILTKGRKGASITLLKGFNDTSILFQLGEKGYLKGNAFQDYLKIKNARSHS